MFEDKAARSSQSQTSIPNGAHKKSITWQGECAFNKDYHDNTVQVCPAIQTSKTVNFSGNMILSASDNHLANDDKEAPPLPNIKQRK